MWCSFTVWRWNTQGSGCIRSWRAVKGRPLWMAGWFAVLALLAWIVGKLVAFEPMISGSGIPQLEGEMVGKLSQKW